MSLRLLAGILVVLSQQLPPPFETPWFRKATRVVPMPEGHRLTVPTGFTVSIFADGLQMPRFMALAPNGDVFIAEPARTAAKITVLRDADRDGVAEMRETFAEGLNRPFGLAFWKSYLYVGNNDSVVRFAYATGQLKATGAPEKIVDLPPSDAALDQDTATRLKIDISQTRGYNHWTRNVIFSPSGTKLYVTVGSATNSTPETDARRAAINEYNPDGSGHRVFANGLRNPVGLAYSPEATRCGRASTNATTSATISCPTTLRRSPMAHSSVGRTATSARTSTPRSRPNDLISSPKRSLPMCCCRRTRPPSG